MTKWMTDAELAEAEEDRAEEEGQRVNQLTKEIKELEALPHLSLLDSEALQIKKKLRRACRSAKAQHLKNAAVLRATRPQMKAYAPRGAAPMSNW